MLGWQAMSRRTRALLFVLLTGALVLALPVTARSVDDLATGKLLVAREGMGDPNFARTVVLLVSYSDSGAMGVVLNRPSHMRLDHLLPHLDLSAAEHDPVFFGGPVAIRQATILSTTDTALESQVKVFGKVHASGDLALLERMVTEPRPGEKFKVFAGHAGWAPGQLEAEVEGRGWLVMPAVEATVFTESYDGLWETLIRQSRDRIAMR